MVNQDSFSNVVEDDIQSKSQRVDLEGSQHGEIRAKLSQRPYGEDKPNTDCDMALCQDTLGLKQVNNVQERQTQFEKSKERTSQSSKSCATKGLGVKSSKFFTRQLSSSGTKTIQGQSVSPSESPKIKPNGSKLQRCEPSLTTELGDMVQEQGSWDSKRDNRANMSSSNEYLGVT